MFVVACCCLWEYILVQVHNLVSQRNSLQPRAVYLWLVVQGKRFEDLKSRGELTTVVKIWTFLNSENIHRTKRLTSELCAYFVEKYPRAFTLHLSTQVDCALAESFYGLNDNIEAFADADNHEIEKPFIQTHDQTPKESFIFAFLLDSLCWCSWSKLLFSMTF